VGGGGGGGQEPNANEERRNLKGLRVETINTHLIVGKGRKRENSIRDEKLRSRRWGRFFPKKEHIINWRRKIVGGTNKEGFQKLKAENDAVLWGGNEEVHS